MTHWENIMLPIPAWLNGWVAGIPKTFPEINQKMALVIDLARLSVKNGGGPFGAAVFH